MLIQLPTGEWVNPETVLGVEIKEHKTESSSIFFVVVHTKCSTSQFSTFDPLAAEQLRDSIADQVNRALHGGKL